MARTNNILVSTLALSACCVAPTIGFTPEAPASRTHVRLDLSLDMAETASAVVRNPSEPLSITVVDDDEINAVGSSNLPPVLQQITDERRNFQVNLGKAMDTLRKDLPYILKETPGKFIASRTTQGRDLVLSEYAPIQRRAIPALSNLGTESSGIFTHARCYFSSFIFKHL